MVVLAGGVFVSGNECIGGKLLAVRKEMEAHEEDKKKEKRKKKTPHKELLVSFNMQQPIKRTTMWCPL